MSLLHERLRHLSEPAHLNMPTVDSTVWNKPGVRETQDIVLQSLTNGIKSTHHEQLLRLAASDAVQLASIREHLASLMDTAGSQARQKTYRKLLQTIDTRYPRPVLAATYHHIDHPVPERMGPIPQRAIDLANLGLQRAYPDQFGIDIPLLTQSDIVLLPDMIHHNYFQKAYNEGEEQYYLKRLSTFLDETFPAKTDSVEPQKRYPEFTIVPILPGKPLLMSDVMMRFLPEGLACILIHENLHRSVRSRTIPLTDANADAWHHLAMGTFYHIVEGASDDVSEEQYDKADGYLEELNTSLQEETGPYTAHVEGAIVQTTIHREGKPQVVASAGYDMNEAIVELLAQNARKKIFSEIRKTTSPATTQFLIDEFTGPEMNTATFKYAHYGSVAPGYLAKLGLHSPSDILTAYIDGRIPQLHIQHMAGERYFP